MKIKYIPQDEYEANRLHHSLNMALCLWDIQKLLRKGEPIDIEDLFYKHGIDLETLLE